MRKLVWALAGLGLLFSSGCNGELRVVGDMPAGESLFENGTDPNDSNDPPDILDPRTPTQRGYIPGPATMR
ncbi:MAG: hypothetical protein ACNA8W_16710 [Bradymonadaceae bacterium]